MPDCPEPIQHGVPRRNGDRIDVPDRFVARQYMRKPQTRHAGKQRIVATGCLAAKIVPGLQSFELGLENQRLK